MTIDRHSVTTAQSGEEALEITSQVDFDLIITDLKMKKLSGIELIKKMRENGIDTITLVLTGYGTINSAVDALKSGAYDYLVKPLRLPILRSKIVEIEKELQLRNKLSVPEMSRTGKLSDISTDIYIPPFFVISTRDPEDIIINLGLSNASTASVSYTQEQGNITPSKLHQLRNTIEEFVKKQEKGTIIFDGIQDILIAHGWKKFKKFIKYLQEEVVSYDYTMLFLIGEENGNVDYDEILLHDALSILSIQAFDTIVGIISHPIRKNIITLLKTYGPSKFTKIAEELDIESTATLTFHIKKLVQESILLKKDNLYTLSTRGDFIDDIIYGLEKAGMVDPGSSVKVLKYQR